MNSKKIVPGFIWRYAEKSLIQLIDLGVNIILARQLAPEVFGTVALVNIFNSILSVFVTSGLGSALVQKKDADDLDFSSVFYFNIGASLLLYALMFFSAPAIAVFYNQPDLTALIRVLNLTLIISGIKNVQNAYVSRNMLFKRFFFASLSGTIIAAVASVVLAYRGAGAWALVALQVLDTLVDTIVLWMTVKWRPKRLFSKERLKGLLTFGSQLLANNIIDKIYQNLRSLIIGKMYSPSDLAFYDKGRKYPTTIYSNLTTTMNSVLFPALSQVQDNRAKMAENVRKMIQTITYLTAPFLFGLAACSDSVVKLLLTEKWMPCVPYMRIFAITYFLESVNSVCNITIKSLGLGKDLLKTDLVKKAFSMTLILISMRINVLAIALSMIVAAVFNLTITNIPVRKRLDYGYDKLFEDMLPPALLAAFMAGCVYCIEFIGLKTWQTLALQIITGAIIYVGGSFLLHLDTPRFLIKTVKELLPARK